MTTQNHTPMFKPSAPRRTWQQRLTPLSWALIVVVGLAVVACAGAGIYAAWRNRDDTFEMDPTQTPTITPGPSPTPEPSPTPTVWYQDVITPTATPESTPTAEAGFPAWWSDQMVQDEDGQWWPPDEVVEQVKADFDDVTEGINEVYFAGDEPDLKAYEEVLPTWYSGPFLDHLLSTYVPEVRKGITQFDAAKWEQCLLQVQLFTEDGLYCQLGRTCNNGTRYFYDFPTETHTTEHVEKLGLVIVGMRYDESDGRWKIHDPIDYIPPGE